jgi:hypothetical protein
MPVRGLALPRLAVSSYGADTRKSVPGPAAEEAPASC